MVIEPKVRGFICTTAHPAGCREAVRAQAEYVKAKGRVPGAKRVLVIGSSTGYGLASRIVAAFGLGAATLGVMFDKPASGSRTASAGWYNTAALEELATADSLYAKTVNGDAFMPQLKEEVIELIRRDLGSVDLVVYSLAAPRRTMPDGTVYSSVLKTTGGDYTNKTIDLRTNQVDEITISAATPEEIEATVKVMGGEDWLDWMKALRAGGVLAQNASTVAYSYIGPELTHPIYLNGSIGRAKEHLYRTAGDISAALPDVKAWVAVNKALVTQSSAAIPVVPLYISILYRVMKEKGLHEGCIQQMQRLFAGLADGTTAMDSEHRLRVDDWEMRPDVQAEVARRWEQITSENVKELADIDGYWDDFYAMFGFGLPGVDYTVDISPEQNVPSLAL